MSELISGKEALIDIFQSQSEKVNAPDFTISDDNQIRVGSVVRVRAISSSLYGYTKAHIVTGKQIGRAHV